MKIGFLACGANGRAICARAIFTAKKFLPSACRSGAAQHVAPGFASFPKRRFLRKCVPQRRGPARCSKGLLLFLKEVLIHFVSGAPFVARSARPRETQTGQRESERCP